MSKHQSESEVAPPKYEEYKQEPPPAAAPPSYQQHHLSRMDSTVKLDNLRIMAEKYELAGGAVAKLRLLEGYDIVVIADDSGSMNNPASEMSPNDPFGKVPTRWEELYSRVTQIMELACCLDQDGIDIYFLNRDPAFNVHDSDRAAALFVLPPRGYTPLAATYNKVLDDKLRNNPEANVLIIIATDGEPNVCDRGTWRADPTGFARLLKTRAGLLPNRCPTTIMACTDSDAEVGWMNKLDDNVPFLDVVDDYKAEREEIRNAQGRQFPFSQGDYVVKTLLGSLDPIYDSLDEEKLTREQYTQYTGRDPGPNYRGPSPIGKYCIIA